MTTISSSITRLLLRGLAIVLPVGLTAAILLWVWNFLSNIIFHRVDAVVEWALGMVGLQEALPDGLRFWISIALVAVLLLLCGWWFSGFLGRRVVALLERLIKRVPLFGAIYPYMKQITEFFFGEEKKVEFERVVAIPYPRREVYSLGFLTGNCLKSLNQARGDELVSVFVPSSPLPATGYTLFVPAADIVPVNLSVEEALRTIVSGGVLVPDQEQVSPLGLSLRLTEPQKIPDGAERKIQEQSDQ
jgi:uncharacterized membrane protein